ncbi:MULTISPECIES: phosphoribosylamine--glycine ligase [unclassified Jeotgalibaca]|uniref:phosphoribosylamine--glycine ligase n=1 Tax=unclassified Jeotgalibaca TaxID=2621505 RepID=UPI003FD26ED2
MGKKILIIGSGGREHALAVAFEKSPFVNTVFVAPGNPGMMIGTEKVECVAISATDTDGLIALAKAEEIDYTFVGPEAAIEVGVVDAFRNHEFLIVGPTKAAGQIETSKIFAKDMMHKADISTAGYRSFDDGDIVDATAYIQTLPLPIVIKESGLAAGKGVYICESHAQAQQIIIETLRDKKIPIVIEEFLEGPEFSHFSLVNGEHVIPLGIARDYKRAFDGDKGLNTGGMGAISPVSGDDESISEEIMQTIVQPLTKQMVENGTPYTGILYTGVMKTKTGLKVIEFNARFGDPETQVLLPLIQVDWVGLLEHHFAKSLPEITYSPLQSVGVMVAAKGYPKEYVSGFVLDLPNVPENIDVFYSGVSLVDGEIVAAGGRVFMVTCQGESLDICRKQIYGWLKGVNMENLFYRSDIGVSN